MSNLTALLSAAMDPEEYTKGFVKPGWLEGSFNSGSGYISWQGGDVTLDGSFSATELRAIADHMEEFMERQ